MEFLIGFAAIFLVFMAYDHFKAKERRREKEAEEKSRICRKKTDAAIGLLQRMDYKGADLEASTDGRSLKRIFRKEINSPEHLTTCCVVIREDETNDFHAYISAHRDDLGIFSTVNLSILSEDDIRAMESFRHPRAQNGRFSEGLREFNLYDWQARRGHRVISHVPR